MVRLLIHTCGFIVLTQEGRALAFLWRRTAAMWVQGVCLHAMCCPSTTAVTLQDWDSQTDNVGVVILPDSVAVFFCLLSPCAVLGFIFAGDSVIHIQDFGHYYGLCRSCVQINRCSNGWACHFLFWDSLFSPLLFLHSKVWLSNRTSGMLNQCHSTQEPFIFAFLTLSSHTHPVNSEFILHILIFSSAHTAFTHADTLLSHTSCASSHFSWCSSFSRLLMVWT